MPEYICPHCKNSIYDDEALLCHFCGESLRRGGNRLLGKIKYGKPRVALIFITALILLSFFLLLIK